MAHIGDGNSANTADATPVRSAMDEAKPKPTETKAPTGMMFFEAERVMTILRDSQENVRLLSALTQSNFKTLRNPQRSLGNELVNEINRMFELEDAITLLKQELAVLRMPAPPPMFKSAAAPNVGMGIPPPPPPGKTSDAISKQNASAVTRRPQEDVYSDIELKSVEYRKAIRNVCNEMRKDHSRMEYIMTRLRVPGMPGLDKFGNAIETMSQVINTRLNTTVEEEKRIRAFSEQMEAKEKKASSDLATLQSELNNTIRLKEKEVKTKEANIADLKKQLASWSSNTTSELRSYSLQSEAAISATERALHDKLKSEYSKLSTSGEDAQSKHRDLEDNLRRRKTKLEGEIQFWISKFDEEMIRRFEEIQELDAELQLDKKKLREVEEEFKILNAKREQILNNQRKIMQKEAIQYAHVWRLHQAAITIQAAWRGRKARILFGKLKKKAHKMRKEKKALMQKSMASLDTTRLNLNDVSMTHSDTAGMDVTSARNLSTRGLKTNSDYDAISPRSDVPSTAGGPNQRLSPRNGTPRSGGTSPRDKPPPTPIEKN